MTGSADEAAIRSLIASRISTTALAHFIWRAQGHPI